jgi:hypothetical protein
MYKELNTYFPDGLSGDGIFTAISQISWFPGVVPANLDTYFMLKHGEKLASKVCDKFADDDGIIQGEKLKQLAQVIHNAFINNWEHEYKTLTVEYNPIENTDFVETIKDKNHRDTEGGTVTTGKTSNTSVTTGKMTNDNDVKVAGFDSVANVPSSDSTSTTDYTGDGTDPLTVTSTTDYGTKEGTPMSVDSTGKEDGTYERELRRHGNIGVTTNAQMIIGDLDVWKLNNFYDILSSDICKVIALSIF